MEEGSLCLKLYRFPGHEHTWIKAKNKVTFSLYFSSGEGLVSYGTPLCPLFRKADIQHIMVVVKTTLFRFCCI